MGYCPHLLFFFLLALSLTARAEARKEVRAFIIPHSHCDPGWLDTFEGYHNRQVERILTEVMNALDRSPNRRFVWAEISYFSRWFDTKNLETRQKVRKFVENGQLEFVEGGWVQPDEANTNFDILVNQLTEGHDYLLKNFGVRPRFAWQIDPFGHSSMTPTLAAAVGFDALVINRIHHNLKYYFKQTRHMEFVWQGSPTLGEQSEIFTHVLHTHYSAPLGFDFEEGVPAVTLSTVGARAGQLASELKSRSDAYRTPNLLVTFGDDFKFQRAEHQFSNMDMLIEEINNGNYGVKIQYATLSEYFDAVFAANVEFPLYKGDFFPYADNSDSYWTGYYTTRPILKGLTRRATSILHSAETAYALARSQESSRHLPTLWDSHYANILQGRRDTALVQHHDGITGTAKPHVAADYTSRLNTAVRISNEIIADMTKHLLYNEEQGDLPALEDVAFGVFDEHDHLFNLNKNGKDEYPLAYHNGLGWTRYQYVRAKVSASDPSLLRVFDADGNPVPVQTSPFYERPATEPTNKSVFYLNFLAEVPPLGVSTYFVRVVEDASTPEAPREHQANYYASNALEGAGSELTIDNEFLELTLSPRTGLPDTLTNKLTGQKITLKQKYAEYTTSRSGAYLFRPTGVVEPAHKPQVSIVRGELMSEVVVALSAERKLTLRLYSAPNDPLSLPELGGVLFTSHQVEAGSNREVVVRYSTDIPTNSDFYTDNGLEMQLRSRDGNKAMSRAHIEASRAGATETQYYPSISIAMLRHTSKDLQFTVISSQSMGTTSHTDGGLEIMIHRHLSQDDGRGLGEGVVESQPVTVQQWLMVGHVEDAELHRRRLSLQQDHPLTPVTLTQSPPNFVWDRHFVNLYAPLTASLPSNVHLLSLKARDSVSSEVVLRLVHIAEGTEAVAAPESALPRDFQSPVTVKLGKLFSPTTNGWVIAHPRERSLSLNYGAEEVERRVRYDSSLGRLNMHNIDLNGRRGGVSQNTDEEGVFLSQAALDELEKERAGKRQPLSLANDYSDDDDYALVRETIDPVADEEAYRRDVQQRGLKRRVFDPASVAVPANGRKLLAVGQDTDPLKLLLRPLQMKSLLLLLEKTAKADQPPKEDKQPAKEDKQQQQDEEKAKEDLRKQQKEEQKQREAQARKEEEQKQREAQAKKEEEEKQQRKEKEEEQRKQREEQRQREAQARKQEEERQRQQAEEEQRLQREQQKQSEKEEQERKQAEEQKQTDTSNKGGRRAEASFPGVRSEGDVLAAEQRFLSTGLEAERAMMMFLTVVIISLMILAYLAFHRRHASAIISVSSLASAAYPWLNGNGSASPGAGPSGRDFYRREMDQRLYSKMV